MQAVLGQRLLEEISWAERVPKTLVCLFGTDMISECVTARAGGAMSFSPDGYLLSCCWFLISAWVCATANRNELPLPSALCAVCLGGWQCASQPFCLGRGIWWMFGLFVVHRCGKFSPLVLPIDWRGGIDTLVELNCPPSHQWLSFSYNRVCTSSYLLSNPLDYVCVVDIVFEIITTLVQ